MRHIFEVTMKIKKPQEGPHLQQITYRLYDMTRAEAIKYSCDAAGDKYECYFIIAGPRLDD